MKNALAPNLQLADFTEWYARNRTRSTSLFDMIDPQAYYTRPIPLRHPIAFYEGHLPAFSFITIARDTFGMPSVDEKLERLFQRGIDPADETAAASHSINAWPSRDTVRAFAAECDARVNEALAKAQAGPSDGRGVQAAYTVLEHEPMHHETLLYIFHRVPYEMKAVPGNGALPPDGVPPPKGRILIPAGSATLGARRDAIPFGWDNEFPETVADVDAFSVDAHSVTNADYLEFVAAGGPLPPFWIERDGSYLIRGMFAEAPLPRAWPVYVSHDQATAYALWKGARLATEAEYHRAAYGTPGGDERPHPWGDAPPSAEHGNFDFQRWDPDAAGSHPAGASAWGVHDLVGNGWEWTSSTFRPFPGFEPMITYPPYSSDFFDEGHYVVKGASAITARELLRRSLRNWYRPNYPYIYAKFRCVG
jgi:formylglycine-generating enzyme required for sulfatase activity